MRDFQGKNKAASAGKVTLSEHKLGGTQQNHELNNSDKNF